MTLGWECVTFSAAGVTLGWAMCGLPVHPAVVAGGGESDGNGGLAHAGREAWGEGCRKGKCLVRSQKSAPASLTVTIGVGSRSLIPMISLIWAGPLGPIC